MSDDNVELTVPFHKTVIERIQSDPEFRAVMLEDIAQLIYNGYHNIAYIMLGNIIEADEADSKE